MKKLLFLTLFFPVVCYGQVDPALRFFNFMNAYKADSLELMLAEDFILKRTYSNHGNNKTSFLNDYLSSAKNCNAKFLIIKTLSVDNPVQLLGEDRSDYLTYLDIRPVLWKITIDVSKDKIKSMTIDTVKGISKDYFEVIAIKMKMFEDWMNKEYPGEITRRLYEEPGLLTRRLSEFAKLEDSH